MSEIKNKMIRCSKCFTGTMVPMPYPLEDKGFTCMLCANDVWIKQVDMSSTWRRNLMLDTK